MGMESKKIPISSIIARIAQILDHELPEVDARISHCESSISGGTETTEELNARKELLEFFKNRKKELEEELDRLSKKK